MNPEDTVAAFTILNMKLKPKEVQPKTAFFADDGGDDGDERSDNSALKFTEEILFCTDKSRLILISLKTGKITRNFYGAEIDEYDTPQCCFSHDGQFVYATSNLRYAVKDRDGEAAGFDANGNGQGAGEIVVWRVANQQQIVSWSMHKVGIRCMALHPEKEMLCTTAFDKALKIVE